MLGEVQLKIKLEKLRNEEVCREIKFKMLRNEVHLGRLRNGELRIKINLEIGKCA